MLTFLYTTFLVSIKLMFKIYWLCYIISSLYNFSEISVFKIHLSHYFLKL